jgi:hypothetical protein
LRFLTSLFSRLVGRHPVPAGEKTEARPKHSSRYFPRT